MKLLSNIVLLCLLTLASTLWGANWTSLTPLPDGGYYGQSLAYASNFLYQAGGNSYSNGATDGINVFFAQVQTNGTIGAWKPTTSLPLPVFFHAGVAGNGFAYVLGGYSLSQTIGLFISDTVYYAKINSDGSLGSWQSANSLPDTLFYFGASVWNNTIYVVGGTDGQVEYSNVYSATIQSDGSLSAWVSQPSIPVANYAQAGAANGMLYVLGGVINNSTMQISNVYYSKINSDGLLSGWNQTTPLPKSNNNFGAEAASGLVITIGGYNNDGAPINACYTSIVMGDGSLGVWSAGTSLPQYIGSPAVTENGSYIFLSGGADSNGNALSQVYSMALPAAPSEPGLTSSNFVNGSFQLRLTSTQTNIGFGLLASTNLTTWTNIAWGFIGTNGLLILEDTNASQFPQCFYKAYWPLP